MSGETAKHESGLTVDTLKMLMDQRFTDQEKAVQSALAAAKEAVSKAENASNKRFEAVNEFRAVLSDQSKELLTRTEYTGRHQSLIDKIDSVTTRVAAIENQTKGSDITMGKIYAAIGAVGAILGIIVLLANAFFK